jgi:Flp pilus assembly protein TadD
MMRKILTLGMSILVATAAMALGGCGASLDQLTSLAVEKPIEPASYGVWSSMRHLDKGKFAYRQGDFGVAVDAFSKAVEEEKENAEAWLGLAAAYDRLKRFDQARRAYDVVIKIVGHTPTVLNNLGYHYYLKGDKDSARRSFDAALRGDPDNVVAKNNLALFWEPLPASDARPPNRL